MIFNEMNSAADDFCITAFSLFFSLATTRYCTFNIIDTTCISLALSCVVFFIMIGVGVRKLYICQSLPEDGSSFTAFILPDIEFVSFK